MFNFNPSVAEGQLNAPLFNFIKIILSLCAQHLTGVATVVIDQKPKNLKYKGKPAKLKISESLSELTEMMAEALQGKMTSARSSGECEFLVELSLFALQESSEATLYK